MEAPMTDETYQYGKCHKCGGDLSAADLRNGAVMCSKCREKAFYEQQDSKGWF
jgi:RNA polymerase-binding transcription factor DksA